MANEIIPPNTPFTRAVERARAARRTAGVEETPAPRPSGSPKARLNFIPDDSMLSEMVERALDAISRGARWARGAIINLVV